MQIINNFVYCLLLLRLLRNILFMTKESLHSSKHVILFQFILDLQTKNLKHILRIYKWKNNKLFRNESCPIFLLHTTPPLHLENILRIVFNLNWLNLPYYYYKSLFRVLKMNKIWRILKGFQASKDHLLITLRNNN